MSRRVDAMRKDALVNPNVNSKVNSKVNRKSWQAIVLIASLVLSVANPPCAHAAGAGDVSNSPAAVSAENTVKESPSLPIQLPDLTKKENLSSAMQIIVLLTVLSLAPAILIMMTTF